MSCMSYIQGKYNSNLKKWFWKKTKRARTPLNFQKFSSSWSVTCTSINICLTSWDNTFTKKRKNYRIFLKVIAWNFKLHVSFTYIRLYYNTLPWQGKMVQDKRPITTNFSHQGIYQQHRKVLHTMPIVIRIIGRIKRALFFSINWHHYCVTVFQWS